MRGKSSPESISTMRQAPSGVCMATRPGFSVATSPMTTLSRPYLLARIASNKSNLFTDLRAMMEAVREYGVYRK